MRSNNDVDMTILRQFTIYDHPLDYPTGFVVREWLISAAGLTSGRAWRAPTLDAARALIPDELFCLPRDVTDDPVIVETWT